MGNPALSRLKRSESPFPTEAGQYGPEDAIPTGFEDVVRLAAPAAFHALRLAVATGLDVNDQGFKTADF